PGTADAQNYLGYRQAGVNRLSIGIQSFDDKQLQQLGRIHDSAQANAAFKMARAAGFDRINLDLMYALAGQSVADAMLDLEQAIALQPEHISWYQLTIEPNTRFSNQPPENLPDEDMIWEIQQAGMKKLQQAGYHQYEISAWSKAGEQCEHNLNYWNFGDYLGIGAGAHGKISDVNSQQVIRTRRKKQPHHWTAKKIDTLAEASAIEKNELALEFMMNAMRLNHGVLLSTFSERTGLTIAAINEQLKEARKLELLDNRTDLLKPTEKGLMFLNDLLSLFMPENISLEKQGNDMANNIIIKEV
ncbi:MAG: oxygen-independent coproporphyrinogen III oxidase-like protein, partial [Gammaproteobacteria bacterium]